MRGRPNGGASRKTLMRQYVPIRTDPLNAARIMKGLSRADVAKKIGVIVSTYYGWEKDGRLVKRESFYRLCEVLGIDPMSLIGGEPEWLAAQQQQDQTRAKVHSRWDSDA